MFKIKTIGLLGLLFSLVSFGQDFTADDYKKANWMTTRFYGAQRSGLNNWTIYNHLPQGVPEKYRGTSHIEDSDGSYDLSGGWNDCGDHVKFGQTQYYSGYMLLKAYDEFPLGFDDLYSHDYQGYNSQEKYDYEDGAGEPNGIPDILDEVKHATDYFIKCARNSTTFYYQVGNGGSGGTGGDHTHRVTSVLSQTLPNNEGGQDRPIGKNPNDGRMPALCAASLALMSRVYRKYDAEYADLCLTHAKYAYDYAAAHKGESAGTAFGGFYGASDRPTNEHAIMLAEMYWATGQESYKTEALAMNAGTNNNEVSPNTYYTFDYANTGELALYVLGELGNTSAWNALQTHLNSRFIGSGNYNGEGAYSNGGNWGKLRYVGNAGFLAALYSKMAGTSLNARVYDNVDYVMGANNNSLSFIAGFETNGVTSVRKPHHRNVYRNDEYLGNSDNSLSIADNNGRNFQFGSLVGGSLTSSGYSDVWSEYVNTEVCIDYNAGLVGALGAIVAEQSPVDTNKFNAGIRPDLGEDQSICGVSSITLDANIPTDNVKTFTWYNGDNVVVGASVSANTYQATSAGTYKVVVDSLGEWETSDEIVISGVLPVVDLGEDVELCTPSYVTLEAGVTGAGVSYQWTLDGMPISNDFAIEVVKAGTYAVEVSASGCNSQSDNVVVTSLLPDFDNGVICNGSGTMYINDLSGDYYWYTTEDGTNSVFNGAEYSVSTAGTYWVEDRSSFSANIGPSESSGQSTNWGEKGYSDNFYLEFSTDASFSVLKLTLPYEQIYQAQDAVVAVDIYNTNGELQGTFTSDSKSLTANDAGMIEFTFSDFVVDVAWGNNLRMALNTNGTTVAGQLAWHKDGTFTYPYNDASNTISITGANAGGQTGTNYVFFYDWEVLVGSACSRFPVKAEESTDCTVQTNGILDKEAYGLYPNPAKDYLYITGGDVDQVVILDAVGAELHTTSSNTVNISDLSSGLYYAKVFVDEESIVLPFVVQ